VPGVDARYGASGHVDDAEGAVTVAGDPSRINQVRPPFRAGPGRLLRVAAALGAVALVTACSSGSVGRAGDADTEEAGIQSAADLQEEFSRLPGAVSASVTYQDNATRQAALMANVRVVPGTDLTATIDVVEQRVWSSDIAPLDTLSITVADQSTPPVADGRDYDLTERTQVDALTERWGERP
jgi:hypothetical protein